LGQYLQRTFIREPANTGNPSPNRPEQGNFWHREKVYSTERKPPRGGGRHKNENPGGTFVRPGRVVQI
jgi:hypothetical protein